MPCTIAIAPSRQVVFTTSTGLVTDADLVGVLAVMRESKVFHPDMRCLADFTRVRELRVTPVALEALVAAQPFSSKSRRAYLVREGAVAVAVGAFGASPAPGQVRLFSARDQALGWLNEEVKMVQALT